jgi:hypothetical protein
MSDASREKLTEYSKRRLPRKAKIVLGIGVLVLALSLSEGWGIGALCPKCLQGAHITLIKVAGIPVFKWTSYDRYMRLSPSWSGQTITVPNDIYPAMYAEILGHKCRHELKKDGFSATIAPFSLLGAHKDGAFSERRLYQPRIEAVAALYIAFANVRNVPLAQRTYAKIDSLLPMNREDRLREVHSIRKMLESGGVSEQELKLHYPEAFPMYQAIERLKVFAIRLSTTKSEEQWVGLLRDLDEPTETANPPGARV